MGKEPTPESADEDDWLKPYSENAHSRPGATTVVDFLSWRKREHRRSNKRLRTIGVMLAAAVALGLSIATAATLIRYSCINRQAAASEAGGGAGQRRPAISPLEMMMEQGAKLPIEHWHGAF
jgi:hypothetical protein